MLTSTNTLTTVKLIISISKSTAAADLHTLEYALVYLSHLFSLNCLALNHTKSEIIICNSTLFNISHINVAGSTVPRSDTVKLLGVTLDKSLTFHKQVKQVSQSCYISLEGSPTHQTRSCQSHCITHRPRSHQFSS